MKKLDQAKIPVLKQDIECILKYLGHKITEKDFPEYNSSEGAWQDKAFKNNQITLVKVVDTHCMQCYYYAEYDGETVFFYDSSSEADTAALYSQEFMKALEPLVCQARELEKRDPEVMKEREEKRKAKMHEKYSGMARMVALELGMKRVKSSDEYYEFYEHYFEDNKIIIKTDDTVDFDTEVCVKMKDGTHLVLDDSNCLTGSWTEYLTELFQKTKKIRLDAKNGFIDDKVLFQ